MDSFLSYLRAQDTGFGEAMELIERFWPLLTALALFGIAADAALAFYRQHRPRPDCPFCQAATGKPITKVVRRWRWLGVLAIEVLNPVTPGHIVVISRWHTRDAGENPFVTALLMWCAARLMGEELAANLITSKGAMATQSVFCTHVHIVPRRAGDELALPWTGQVIEQAE